MRISDWSSDVCSADLALAGIEEGGGTIHHQRRRLALGVGAGDGKLHALILPDGASEHLALRRIAAGLVDEPAGVADAFGGDEDALGVHAVAAVAAASSEERRVGKEWCRKCRTR